MDIFVEFLKKYHQGESGAITATELTGNGWGSARQIRRIVHASRELGHPVCSSSKGYFYPKIDAEKRLCKKRLMNMGKGIFKVTRALKAIDNRQLSLFDGY